MTDFRARAARLDDAVFKPLAEMATLDGVPVCGMLSAPWTDPRLGSMHTGIVEPRFTVRDADAIHAPPGAAVKVMGKAFEVIALEPDGSGLTGLVLRAVLP